LALYLGLDSSTQSLTAVIIEIDRDRRRLVLETTLGFDEELPQYGTRHGVLPDPGPAVGVSPPLMWVDALDLMMGRLAHSGVDVREIAAVSGSAQQHGSVYLDATAGTALASLDKSVALMSVRRMLGMAKLRGALEYILDMLDNLPPERKVLVFAHHAEVIALLAQNLAAFSPAVLTGKTTPREREFAVDKFLTDPKCRVFIGNIQAAGTAITLVGPRCKCSDVVFVESSWTPMDNAQAACRVHRIGQKDGVVARMLSAAGTVDDLINSLLVRKAREFTQLFDTEKVHA